ncbi:hypothetical protein Barb6_03101 [Bacteroidales bacterium Barb6]|nr:hypothetical protein Barb6_03101 [Bacteroidales bacterium Barb6]
MHTTHIKPFQFSGVLLVFFIICIVAYVTIYVLSYSFYFHAKNKYYTKTKNK